MKYCNQCQVSVNNPIERCPLCFAQLIQQDAQPEQQSYPGVLLRAERYNLIRRILFMISLTISVICVTINLVTAQGLTWSLIVLGNITYMWVAITTAVKKRTKLGHNLLIQTISLALLLILIDRFTGNLNWALNYVVPFLFMTATLCITIILLIKRMDVRSFILYFFLTALIGFVPILLMAMGLVTVLWPSLASAIYSGLSLVSLFVFADRSTKEELKKRFHV